jgi:methyltransferase-like protein/SAM-dependent methyltransferase
MPDTLTQPVSASENTYDQVPYESHPFSGSHPDRLATVATLFGLRPAPIQHCRVLELGCASGGNLIPMGEQLPESQFLGIDFSAQQIADGQQLIEHLGLSNVELRHASILDVDEDYGLFDYIITHDVYSWVPPEVQEKILDLVAHHLHPHGVAYISYNTYPGWHMRGLIHELMRFHTEHFASPTVRTRQARAILDFLASSVRQDGSAYSALLKSELETLQRQPDSHLFHEHLEEVHAPLFFHEFVERLDAHQLQYLGESRLGSMALSGFQADVAKALRILATDQVQAEQYMDFLRNRTFRQTLVCRQGLPVNWSVPPDVLRKLYFASRCVPVNDPGPLQSENPVTYRTPAGATLTTATPLIKSALRCLREAWPRALAFDRLRQLAHQRLGEPCEQAPARDLQVLGVGLLDGHVAADLVDLHAAPIPCVPSAGDRPVVSLLARLQAARGPLVTNRRHEAVRVSNFDRRLLPFLNGQHDRESILDDLVEAARNGIMEVQREDEVLTDPQAIRIALNVVLEQALKGLAMNALLVG